MRNLLISSALLCLVTAGAGACGSDAEGGSGTGGSGAGLCVGDQRTPAGCAISWELMDACPNPMLTSMTMELAVFADGCPADDVLRSGATAPAIYRAAFSPSTPFPAVTGLEKKLYGFAFVARSADCVVTAFGCTEANLAEISLIKTAVCDWSDTSSGAMACACTPIAGGGCPLPETCSAGSCSGAT